MALAQPLQFVDRFDGQSLGLSANICLFRNEYVLLRVDYCSEVDALGTAGAPAAWVTGSAIYSSRGEEVSLYAEVSSSGSVYEAPRSAYTMFKVEYRDRSAAGEFDLGLDVDGYKAYLVAADALLFGSYPSCFEDFEYVTRQEGNTSTTTTRNLGRIRCTESPRELDETWTREGTEYLRDPPKLWFTYLDTILALIAEGERKPVR